MNLNANVCIVGPLRPLAGSGAPVAGEARRWVARERRSKGRGTQGVDEGQLIGSVDVTKQGHSARSCLFSADRRHPTIEQGDSVGVVLDGRVNDNLGDLAAGRTKAGANRLHDHGVLVDAVPLVAVGVDRRRAEDGARGRSGACAGPCGVLHRLSLLEQGAVVDDAGDDRNEERGDHRELNRCGASFGTSTRSRSGRRAMLPKK